MDQVNIFPNPQQELLLKACLLTGDEAIAAWKKWQANNEIEQLDRGSYRLLPLLHHNLTELQIADPRIDELKKIYQNTLIKNQLLFASAARLFKVLQEHAVGIYLLKGSALSLLCYHDPGLRPMDDIDILIDIDKVFPVMQLLEQEGWQAKSFASTKQITPGYLLLRHGHGFKKHFAMDLHWHVLSECCDQDDDMDFKQRSIPLQFQGLQVHTLSYTDHLLHTIVHGIKWDPTPSIRWIADAIYIINSAKSDLDWQLLVNEAEKRRLILEVKTALEYLQKNFNVVPDTILTHLEKLPVKKAEYREFAFKARPKSRSLFITIQQVWYQHTRKTKHANLIYRIFTLPKFLQMLWGLDSVWKVPVHFFHTVLPTTSQSTTSQ